MKIIYPHTIEKALEKVEACFPNDFQALMDEFIAFGEKEGVKLDETGFNTSKKIIEVRLKAGIAQNIWDFGSFYEIINEINPIYNKALEVLKDDTFNKMKIAYNNPKATK